MATDNYSTVFEHSNDATFRAWGSALSASLATVGLTQTADTGQINWTTVTRPGINTAAGYEIWRFNDTLQGTAPIFLKIEYGTNNTAAGPQIWVTVGTGSNGSGTLTGTTSTRRTCLRNGAPSSTSTPYPTYVCYNATHGFLGVMFKLGASGSTTSGSGGFFVARSCDQSGGSAGDTNATGCVFYSGDSSTASPTVQSIRFAATAAAYSVNVGFCTVPGDMTSSLVGADNQAFLHWAYHPQAYAVKQIVTVITSEVPIGNTISCTPVGASARTFISGGTHSMPGNSTQGFTTSSVWGIAMLWE